MPILHSSGVIIPGQLGPISLLLPLAYSCFSLIISIIGIPSVIQTMSCILAFMASMIAEAANFGGT